MVMQDYVSEARTLNEFTLKTDFGFPTTDIEKIEFEGGYNKLVEIARQHIGQRQLKVSKGDGNIWVIHPSCEEIDNGERPKQVQRLLDYIRKNNDWYRTILISDAIDYIINDHNFVEEDLFEEVVLTEPNQGKPLELSNLNPFKDRKQNLVGGCYVGMCLDVFVEVLEETMPDKKIKVVRKWSYDPHNLTIEETLYNVLYSLSPSLLRSRLSEPRRIAENIFVPKGTI